MAFLKQIQVDEIKEKLVSDASRLGKLYKAKKSEYQHLSIDHSLVDGYLKEGWETEGKPLKTKTKIRKPKIHSKKFEDDIWCQLYNLGYRTLNFDENFVLPFSKNEEDKKQIDIIAVNGETILLVECKASVKLKKAPSYKDEFDVLEHRMEGFIKSLKQIFGTDKKIKFIFATRNLRINVDSEDLKRLENTNTFYYNNNTYDYVNNLIKNYKNASLYQFLGLVFKNETINLNKIEIPAVNGKMGNKDYFMFSIEPSLLLKMGFILHRTRANESEFPTYQRLLVPSRLKGITKYIDDGGYFPNSIIINFNNKKNKIKFEPHSKSGSSNSRTGMLKIPNAYGIAYIIDGQHRVYGYANSEYVESNTIPVVAFNGLDSIEQLEIFMDINQNQKAVSPSLRLDLEEDLYWDSDRADSRLKALRSSIIKKLGNSESSPLFNKISVGEDKAILTFKPFTTALANSGLLPSAKGNKYNEDSLIGSLYNTNNQNHNQEMNRSKKKIVDFIIHCYDYVEQTYPEIYNRDKYFIVSNRGTFAFISLIGDLNKFETGKNNLSKETKSLDRFEKIKPYLKSLFDSLSKLSIEEENKQLTLLGAGADTKWLRYFQSFVNNAYPNYNPPELIDWKERQNEVYQSDGRKYIKEVERFMKKRILKNLKILFEDNWELEIETIQSACQLRANAENKKNYKDGIKKRVEWTEMFSITDYKVLIEKYWTKKPEPIFDNYITFEETFAIDIGIGNRKPELLKWISYFNSYRNQLAHEGTKNKGINKKEVDELKTIYDHFFEKN
ncbi:DGQHR domain-containing protein [Olleya sp. R77988]|uniref:DGQHR domain-containing protein n=1 Tax=Olleya sp. R77988 TaxID=3093875 RepID=UPI0037CB1213